VKAIAVVAFVMVGTLSLHADARPGGGSTYSGGSHSSSSGGSYHPSSSGGGGGGGSDSAGAAIVGLVLAAVVIGFAIAVLVAQRNARPWDSVAPNSLQPTSTGGANLDPILRDDPDFSLAVFEDFAFELYAAAHRAASDPARLAALAPYLSPVASAQLASRDTTPIQQVVVGALRVVGADVTAAPFATARAFADAGGAATDLSRVPTRQRLAVRIESNLAAASGTAACVEHWVFTRAIGARTRPPTRTRTWPCPNCGAPWSAGDDPRTCAHCGQATAAGRFDWTVEQIWLDSTSSVGQTLIGTVAEVGNDWPTVVDPDAEAALDRLTADDPAVTRDALAARLELIYARLNTAWNASDLTSVRGLVTHSLLDYLRYWLDEYRRQGLANHLDDATPHRVVLAKVVRDHYYDAITMRVFADGLDYTVDLGGHVLGGSKDTRRAYTEYWTLVRSASRRGAVTTTPTCPSCGAPLAISDAGTCTHCNAEVESGAFDWVLSKIEQDDVYRG
jgi:hypothetical protein